MLHWLEGTFLDLRPEFWAAVIVAGLVVIEIFQLGPHSLDWKRKKPVKTEESNHESESKNGGKKPKVKLGTNVKKRHRKSHLNILKVEAIRKFILVNEPCAFLFAFSEKNADTNLVPELHQAAATPTANSDKVEGKVYPPKVDPGNNYAVAQGEEAEVAVLDRLEDLVKVTDCVSHIVIFSSMMPSVFALHKLVELKKKHCEAPGQKVEVSVLYEGFGAEESDNDITQLEDKNQFLLRNSINLQRVAIA